MRAQFAGRMKLVNSHHNQPLMLSEIDSIKVDLHLTTTTKLKNVRPIIENIWAMAIKKFARKKCENFII